MNVFRIVLGATVQPSKYSDKTEKEMFPYRSRFR